MTKGIGPGGSSLLEKLGGKRACDMSLEELNLMVSRDQDLRSRKRVAGRVMRAIKEKPPKPIKVVSLEQLGLSPAIVEKLRATGKSDIELIEKINRSGLL